MPNTARSGETIKLIGKFHDFDGTLVDPETVKLILYNERQKQIQEILLNSANKESIGVYSYLYIVPFDMEYIYFAFEGDINGTPSLGRDLIEIIF